jgi:hypothetical protein
MSLRMLIRLGALGLGLLLFSPLLWQAAGPWPLFLGLGLFILLVGYLLLSSGRPPISRWQLRYRMEARQANERLDATLSFLAGRAGHVVLEANSQGLFLEAPATFDRYVQVQLEQALPEARVSRLSNNTAKEAVLRSSSNGRQPGEALHLCLDPLAGDPLRWATEGRDRQVRLHLQGESRLTLVARSADDSSLPGSWARLPVPGVISARLWERLPVWDELAASTRPSHLLPTTNGNSVYSSQSRLFHLAPPGGHAMEGERRVGGSAGGGLLSLSYAVPLFTVGAPATFLAEQALNDLQVGRSVVIVSPHRRVLNQIQRQAQARTYWIDPESSRASAHLAVVDATEWHGLDVETVIGLVETFLIDLGLDLHLPALRTLVRHLVRILAASALATGHDFAFTDLYAISQNTQILRAFLGDLADLAHRLDPEARESIAYLTGQLDGDASYVQVVTILSMMRTILSPLRGGTLHALCQPPFLDAGQALRLPSLFLVPMTNADFPEYDRFLAAMLDLVLKRVLAAGHGDLKMALHLHDPHRYRNDAGQRWIDVAGRDDQVSLLVDVQDPDRHILREDGGDGEIIFRCSEVLASALIADWDLDYTVAELTELPAGAALARMPGRPGLVILRESR